MSAVSAPVRARITCVISSLGCGGAERVMVGLAGRLAALGYRVSLLTTEDVPDFFDVPVGVSRRALPAGAVTSCRWFDLRRQRQRTQTLRTALLRDDPQVVISFVDSMNVAALLALSGSGVPLIAAEHTDPRRHRIGLRWSWLRRWYYPRASRVVLLTADVRDWALRLWPRWRAVAIPNAVESDGGAGGRPEGSGPRTLLAMGRLGPEKGFDILLEAFARLAPGFPDWQLRIYGEGGERARLEALIDRLGLAGRAHLPGIVRRPGDFLAQADVFAVPSRYEGFSMVLAEAMALGVPAVATACSGPAAIIRDGIDGLLVPPEDPAALAQALARLMLDGDERRCLGARAVEVAERFSPERIVGQWQSLIESVLAESGRSR